MCTLKVPFEGNSIQELYKKINRGVISKIPDKYSPELTSIIKLCLTKDQKKRPNVEELLEHETIQMKMKQYDIQIVKGEDHNFGLLNDLMGTIKLPKNLDQLIQRLPKKRYNSVRAYSSENIRKKSITSNKKKYRITK
jgi:NIMA (never in mitosis gene a)-related kinase